MNLEKFTEAIEVSAYLLLVLRAFLMGYSRMVVFTRTCALAHSCKRTHVQLT